MSRKPPKLIPAIPLPTTMHVASEEAMDKLLTPDVAAAMRTAGTRVFVPVQALPIRPLSKEQLSQICRELPALAAANWRDIETARQNYVFLKLAQAEAIAPSDLRKRLDRMIGQVHAVTAEMDIYDTISNEIWRRFALAQRPSPSVLPDRDEIYPVMTWLAARLNDVRKELVENPERNVARPDSLLGMTPFDKLCDQIAEIAQSVSIPITTSKPADTHKPNPSDFQRFVWQIFASIPLTITVSPIAMRPSSGRTVSIRDDIGTRTAISSAFLHAVADWKSKRRGR